ncbi:hypothetical protein CKAH01_04554, partial [Colletotrichum kahawae]
VRRPLPAASPPAFFRLHFGLPSSPIKVPFSLPLLPLLSELSSSLTPRSLLEPSIAKAAKYQHLDLSTPLGHGFRWRGSHSNNRLPRNLSSDSSFTASPIRTHRLLRLDSTYSHPVASFVTGTYSHHRALPSTYIPSHHRFRTPKQFHQQSTVQTAFSLDTDLISQ